MIKAVMYCPLLQIIIDKTNTIETKAWLLLDDL